MKASRRARLAARLDQEEFNVGCESLNIGMYSEPIWFCR